MISVGTERFGKLLLEVLHVPVCDFLDEESRDFEAWIRWRSGALILVESDCEDHGDAAEEHKCAFHQKEKVFRLVSVVL